MPKIRILPDQLANQIAAGEVIERPASVVKELLENSLDAGASRIEIEIEGSGTRLIRIVDNGEGMDEDDLLLCLERHGTSKINTEEDLGAISTLGFRGEAIPSIGSVAHLTISSRVAGSALGTTVVLRFGKLLQVHEVGCSFGTLMEVRNLFGNTPARRKFLRTARTELGHIEEVVKNYALAASTIGFILRIDNKEMLRLDPGQTERERLTTIMHYHDELIELGSPSGMSRHPSISGFLVPPDKITLGQPRLRVFVNGRAVRDRMIVHAVVEGMHSFLMKGKSPSGLIHMHVHPEEVDVNVHPAKHEVRFRHARDIHALITEQVAKAMRGFQDQVRGKLFSPALQPLKSPVPLSDNRESDVSASILEPIPDYVASPLAFTRSTNPSAAPPTSRTAYHQKEDQPHPAGGQDLTPRKGPEKAISNTSPPELKPNENTATGHNLQIIGQIDNLYIFCRNQDGLLVIDQHAAHERLLYEKFHRQYFRKTIAKQNLLFPETVELSIQQGQLVEKHAETIERLGVSLRDFGGNTYVITAVPAIAAKVAPRTMFFDLLEQLGSDRGNNDQGRIVESIIADMACKAAVKAGTELTLLEINNLLNEMARADLFSHCPHGRPVVKQFSREDMKKWFYRG